MTYSPLFPIASIPPKDQVMQIMTNFEQFADIYGYSLGNLNFNHTQLNASHQGDHEILLMQLQTKDPGVTGDFDVIYSKNATSKAGTQPQLFYQMPVFLPTALDTSKPGNLPMQLTYNKVNLGGPQYQSFLPGGYIAYFGKVSATGTVTLVPAPTKIVLAIAYPNNFTSVGTPIPFTVSTNVLTNSTFSINSSAATGSYTFTYIVIAQA